MTTEAQKAARWDFMMKVMDNDEGPEMEAMTTKAMELDAELNELKVPDSEKFCRVLDAAITSVAEDAAHA